MTQVRYRSFDVPAYYHVYNRGAGKQKIFHDAADRKKFISLLARYLDENDESVRSDGLPYEKSAARLIAYCLMGNHFHMMLYQDQGSGDISQLVDSVSISYSMYFNKRHNQRGRLFEGVFRAKQIVDGAHFDHMTRYIHMNPRTYKTYKWSSLPEFMGRRQTDWVYADQVMSMSSEQYACFLDDYVDKRAELQKLKEMLELDI